MTNGIIPFTKGVLANLPRPLIPDQAMRALLKMDPKDVAKLEARERAKKKPGRASRPAALKRKGK